LDISSIKLVKDSLNLAATVGVFGRSVTKRPVLKQLRWLSQFSLKSLNILDSS
jgi:hypothetical protein